MFIPIRNKILISQFVLISFSVFLLGYFGYIFMEKNIMLNDQNTMVNVSEHTKDFLGYLIEAKKSILLRISKSKEFGDYHVTYKEGVLLEYFSRFKEEFPVISYVNKEGFEEVKIINGSNSYELINYSGDNNFKNALNDRNRVVISKVVNSPELKKPVIKFYLAGYGYFEDVFQGVLVASMPVSIFRNEAAQLNLTQKFKFALIDAQGYLVFGSGDAQTGAKMAIRDKGTNNLITQDKYLKKGFFRADLDGVDSFLYSIPVWINDWVLVVYMPSAEFLAPLYILKKMDIAFALVIFILSIIFSILLARYLTNPIAKLLEGTNAIANGKLGQQLDIQTHDEIRILGDSFNKMSANLRQTMVAKDYIDNIVESMFETLIVLNKDAKIKTVNSALCRLLGYNKEELLGRDMAFILEDIDTFVNKDGNFILGKSGKIENYETVYKHKDGRLIFVVLSCSGIENKNEGEINYIITATDITRQKSSEKKLQSAYDELKLLQSKLLQTEKMVAIGQLAGGVAHEINNPLTGVLNNAQLIRLMAEGKEKITISEFSQMLDAIEESALRCKKITESLLDFSRTSIGKFEKISVNTVIDKVVSLVEHEIKLQNILLKVELQPDIPNIQGDVQLLKEIVVNMLSNAKWAVQKKFFKDSGGVIIIRSEYLLGSSYIYVYMIDNGVGIPQDVINRIFEPFFTTKEVGEGTGLGLSLAFSIIEKHQGVIEVKSKVNEGTTFKISLPVV